MVSRLISHSLVGELPDAVVVVVTTVVRLLAGGGGCCCGLVAAVVVVDECEGDDGTVEGPNLLLSPKVRGGFGGTGSTY